MDAQTILVQAYKSLHPFDGKGKLVSEADFWGSKILASASGYLHNNQSLSIVAPYVFRPIDTVENALVFLHDTQPR